MKPQYSLVNKAALLQRGPRSYIYGQFRNKTFKNLSYHLIDASKKQIS